MRTATHMYRNGTVLTMDSRGSRAEAVAVADGSILAVGSQAEMQPLAAPDTVVIDLHGRTMLPGFIDPHSHFVTAGLLEATQINLASPPVGTVRNIGEIKAILRRKAAATPPGGWIVGYGYGRRSGRGVARASDPHPACLRAFFDLQQFRAPAGAV